MTISEVLLADFDAEAANTKRVLERVPTDKSDWKPHDKSMPLGAMAAHVAGLATFGNRIFTTDVYDIAVADEGLRYKFTTTEHAVAYAAGAAAEIRTNLAAMSDADLTATWTLRYGDHVITTAPRHLAYRVMFFNHLIHHRGQLNVYLRLLDIKVPGIYGPSADEPFGS